MRRFQHALLAPLLVLLTACAALGLQPAKTLAQRIDYARGGLTAVLDATAGQLDLKLISSAGAKNTRSRVEDARGILDTAELAAKAGDFETAEGRLAAAMTILTALQAELHKRAQR